jgi:hypothetical protein
MLFPVIENLEIPEPTPTPAQPGVTVELRAIMLLFMPEPKPAFNKMPN